VDNEMYLSRAMDKLGTTSLNKDYQEPDISAAFIKFSVVTKELSILMKTLVSDIVRFKANKILYIDCAMCVI
jgi:Arf-GAP with SH3 domain, ANK repeat and PH domain-containing protein